MLEKNTHYALKVNSAGVIQYIFAVSFLITPPTNWHSSSRNMMYRSGLLQTLTILPSGE